MKRSLPARTTGCPLIISKRIRRPSSRTGTSPTNIGLYLLSILSARDLGWLGTADCLEQLNATLSTIGNLDLFRGHLYNWYDTGTLHPMEPKYISSVDSGNLAGDLLTISRACREFLLRSFDGAAFLTGLKD